MRCFFSFEDDFFQKNDHLDFIWDIITTAVPELRFHNNEHLTLKESLQVIMNRISSASTVDDIINLAMQLASTYRYLPSVRKNFEWMEELKLTEHLRYHLALLFFYETTISNKKHTLIDALTTAEIPTNDSDKIAKQIAKRKNHHSSSRKIHGQDNIINYFTDNNTSPLGIIFNEWLRSVILFPSSNARFGYDQAIQSKIDGLKPIVDNANENYKLFLEYELERFNSHNYLSYILSLYPSTTRNLYNQTYWGDYTHILMLYPLLDLRKKIASECCHGNTYDHQYLDYLLQYQIFMYFPIITALFRFLVKIMRDTNHGIMTTPTALSEYVPDNFSPLELNAIPKNYINEQSKELLKDATNLYYNLHYNIGTKSKNDYFLNILLPELRKIAVQKNIAPCEFSRLDDSIVNVLDNHFSCLNRYRITSRPNIYNPSDNIMRLYDELHRQ